MRASLGAALQKLLDINQESGLKCGSGCIERLEIEAWCPEVAQFMQSSVMQEQAAIGRDVVRDELPKEGPPGRNGRIVRRLPEPSGLAAASMTEPDFPSANNMVLVPSFP